MFSKWIICVTLANEGYTTQKTNTVLHFMVVKSKTISV